MSDAGRKDAQANGGHECLEQLELGIFGGAVGAAVASQLRFGLHALQPAVQTLELLLHLPEFGQGAVELSPGVGQPGLVQPPLLLLCLHSSLFDLRRPPGSDQLSADQQGVEKSLALGAVQLQFLW